MTTDDITFGKRGDALWCYRVGPVYASLCTSMLINEAVAELNRRIEERIPGSTPWKLSTDRQFSGGESNPCPCPDSEQHQHYLLTGVDRDDEVQHIARAFPDAPLIEQLTRERDEARAEVERLRMAAVKLMGHKPWKWVHDEDGSPLQAWAHDDPPDELLIAWLRLRDLANGEAKEAADG